MIKNISIAVSLLTTLLFSNVAKAQVLAGLNFAPSYGVPSVSINDGNAHSVYGGMVTSPVAGFLMMWPQATAPSSGVLVAAPAMCLALGPTQSGSYAASLGLGTSYPSVMLSVTMAFSTATDCGHFTPYGTSVHLSLVYQ